MNKFSAAVLSLNIYIRYPKEKRVASKYTCLVFSSCYWYTFFRLLVFWNVFTISFAVCYSGYLVAAYIDHASSSEFICLDGDT